MKLDITHNQHAESHRDPSSPVLDIELECDGFLLRGKVDSVSAKSAETALGFATCFAHLVEVTPHGTKYFRFEADSVLVTSPSEAQIGFIWLDSSDVLRHILDEFQGIIAHREKIISLAGLA